MSLGLRMGFERLLYNEYGLGTPPCLGFGMGMGKS